MKRVSVTNPTPAGRLAVVNPKTTKAKKRNPSRVKNPTLLGANGLIAHATATAVGGLVTTTVCSMLPLPTSPIFNIAAKLGVAYLLNLAAENGPAMLLPYAAALGGGGAAVAASDALKIAIPAFRTAYVGNAPVIAQVVPATGGPAEPVAIAGYDEMGDIIELGDVVEIGDDEDDMGDIITVSPEWR